MQYLVNYWEFTWFYLLILGQPLVPNTSTIFGVSWTLLGFIFDQTVPEQNTALHLAGREGHVAAVKLLLNQGAEILLNNNHDSFFHEAVHNGKKDVANAAIENERWEKNTHSLFHTQKVHCWFPVKIKQRQLDTYCSCVWYFILLYFAVSGAIFKVEFCTL